MKKINKILVIFFLLIITNHAQSEKHNQVSVELDRIKNDIIDLQKFVYKNESSLNNSNDSNDNIELDELKILINDISKSINSLEKQILDIKDDVSNLYSLYTLSDFDEKKIISTSDQLNIEESSSNIVENSEEDQLLGQISLSELEEDKVNTLDNSIVENEEKTSLLSIEKEELDVVEIKSIFEVNVSIRLRLTNDSGIDTSPSFSPNGEKIVFNSDRGGSPQLFIMDKNGENIKRISKGRGVYGNPVWSPRGDLIAFTKLTQGNFHIGVMDTNGNNERVIVRDFSLESPAWSPNGRYLIFHRQKRSNLDGTGGEVTIHFIDITGYNERVIPTPRDGSDPAWSPLL